MGPYSKTNKCESTRTVWEGARSWEKTLRTKPGGPPLETTIIVYGEAGFEQFSVGVVFYFFVDALDYDFFAMFVFA